MDTTAVNEGELEATSKEGGKGSPVGRGSRREEKRRRKRTLRRMSNLSRR